MPPDAALNEALLKSLRAGIERLGVAPLPDARLIALVRLVDLLGRWNRVDNLTAVRDPERMVRRHLLDSLAVLPHMPPGAVLDVGSGAGFPGLPLAIARPEQHFVLLDSAAKRTRFMMMARAALGLDNVDIVHGRIQDHADGYDVVISRAFRALATFHQWCWKNVRERGVLMAMKGREAAAEAAQLSLDDSVMPVRTVALNVPGEPACRTLVMLTRRSDVPTGALV